jgi:hypothetical protein
MGKGTDDLTNSASRAQRGKNFHYIHMLTQFSEGRKQKK